METINIDIRECVDMVVAFIFLGILSFSIYKKYGKLMGLSTFYFFSSSMAIFMNPFKLYNRVFSDPITHKFYKIDVSISYISAQAFVLGLLIFLYVAYSENTTIKKTFNFLKYFSVINALIASTPLNGSVMWGFTFDITFATLFLPFFYEDIKNEWGQNGSSKMLIDILCVIAIIGSAFYRHPITPLLIITMGLALYFLSKKTIMATTPFFLTGSLIGAWAYSKNEPGHIMERVVVWEKVTLRFIEKFNIWIGSGTGTYRIVGPLLQEDTDLVFYFVHNEYLQAFYEHGIIGLALIISIIYMCFKYINHKPTRISLILLCIASLVQYPLRTGIGFLFCILFVRLAMEQKKDDQWLIQK